MASQQNETNGFLDSANELLNTLTQSGEKVASIYSTFLNAQATKTVADAQKIEASKQTSFSPELADLAGVGAGATKYIVYGAIALAILGTSVVLWRAVKK